MQQGAGRAAAGHQRPRDPAGARGVRGIDTHLSRPARSGCRQAQAPQNRSRCNVSLSPSLSPSLSLSLSPSLPLARSCARACCLPFPYTHVCVASQAKGTRDGRDERSGQISSYARKRKSRRHARPHINGEIGGRVYGIRLILSACSLAKSYGKPSFVGVPVRD